MRRFESSGAAIGLERSTRWKERVEVRKVAICPVYSERGPAFFDLGFMHHVALEAR